MRHHLLTLLALSPLLDLPANANPIATVRNGSYEGFSLPQYQQDLFLGIPYAQDTGGHNRFRIPQSLTETWNGTRLAQNYSDACPDANPTADAVYGMSENCLSINVVIPFNVSTSSGVGLPVLLWIHGGSYQEGTSGLDNYNLTWIVQKSASMGKPIIGASINYREGGWGNLYSVEIQGSGNTNLALRDMRKALAWIQENIAGFGGDPSRVTIWGESSGSFAVGQLLMTYGGRTDGLFHRSIQESGSAMTAWYNGTSWYQPIYDKIVSQVNCSSAPDTLSCLRTIPYKTLYPYMNSSAVGGPGFYPTVDGDIMPNYPTTLLQTGRFAHVPHILGTNSDEGTANAPHGINTDADLYAFLLNATGFDFPAATVKEIMRLYPDDPTKGIPLNTGTERFAEYGWQYKRAAAIMGDAFYHGPRLADARRYSDFSPTYVYRFNTRPFANDTNSTWTDTVGSLAAAAVGVKHFSEVAFVFGNPGDVGPWGEYVALSERMMEMWIRFADGGDPNGGKEEKVWPAYDAAGDGKGRNLVLQTERQGGFYVEEDVYRLEGREYLDRWARRRHV